MRTEIRTVWAIPRSLATTWGVTVVFLSSGYLDVSVRRVGPYTLCFQVQVTGLQPAGFSHSDIRGSTGICPSPRLIAAYHVLHRLLVPRHPPCALSRLMRPRMSLRTIWRCSSRSMLFSARRVVYQLPEGMASIRLDPNAVLLRLSTRQRTVRVISQ